MAEYNGYEIKRDKTYGLFTVHSIGKGALPQMLAGHFQSWRTAQQNIDRYVETKKEEK